MKVPFPTGLVVPSNLIEPWEQYWIKPSCCRHRFSRLEMHFLHHLLCLWTWCSKIILRQTTMCAILQNPFCFYEIRQRMKLWNGRTNAFVRWCKLLFIITVILTLFTAMGVTDQHLLRQKNVTNLPILFKFWHWRRATWIEESSVSFIIWVNLDSNCAF